MLQVSVIHGHMLIFLSGSAPWYDSHSQLYVYCKIIPTQYLRIWVPPCRLLEGKIRSCMHWFWATSVINITIWTFITEKCSSHPSTELRAIQMMNCWTVVDDCYFMSEIITLRGLKNIDGFDDNTPLPMSPHHAPSTWFKWSRIRYMYIQAMKHIFCKPISVI